MGYQKGDKVSLKKWSEITTTIVSVGNNYRHKESNLLIIPGEYLLDINKVLEVEFVDDDETYWLKGGSNYYHENWLDKI